MNCSFFPFDLELGGYIIAQERRSVKGIPRPVISRKIKKTFENGRVPFCTFQQCQNVEMSLASYSDMD